MQYSVQGSDGNTYGPVDLPTLKQWATEGRVFPTSQIINHVTNQRLMASQMPELGITASNPYASAPPPAATYPRTTFGTSQQSELSHILVRAGIAVVLSILFYAAGMITATYTLFYGIRAFTNKDPKAPLCLGISIATFVLVGLWTIFKITTHTHLID